MSEPHRERERRFALRENIEAMTMAVVMALLLKYFVVEAYKIPSGSMQPTLIGIKEPGVQLEDRILVDKLSFHFRDPQRWEVAVFRFPLDRSKNFVKRLVGMPGEYFKIEGGDLWRRAREDEPWEILRRPRSVQSETWKLVDPRNAAETRFGSTSPGWTVEGRTVAARGPGRAEFRPGEGSIMDAYDDGYPLAVLELDAVPRVYQDSGIYPVGDVRLEGTVRALPGCAGIEFQLGEGTRTYSFRVPGPAARPDESPSIQRRETLGAASRTVTEVAPEAYRLPAGERVSFAVQNLDDLLELELEGRVVCSVPVEPAEDQTSSVALASRGEGADFEELAVSRDIYYTSDRAKVSETYIPEGHYFALGDNTQNSSDSREWTFTRYRIEGDADGPPLEVRGSFERGNSNPYVDAGHPDGPVLWLRDEWGERHRFAEDRVTRLPSLSAPFVPREMILGRAVATFWPIRPTRGIYRLGWVE